MADLDHVSAAAGSLRPGGRWRPVVTREDGSGRPEGRFREAGRAAGDGGKAGSGGHAWGRRLGSGQPLRGLPPLALPTWCGAAAGPVCQLPATWLLRALQNSLPSPSWRPPCPGSSCPFGESELQAALLAAVLHPVLPCCPYMPGPHCCCRLFPTYVQQRSAVCLWS